MELETFIATLVPGQLCNVSEPRHPALMRVVTKVERVKKNGQEWARWHWVPGDAIPADHVARRGMVDCGYSGAVIA
jgi:hypothetical protein